MSELAEVTPCFTLTFRRVSKHPPSRVWSAITDAAEASKWMGCPIEIDLRVGGHWHAFQQKGDADPWLPGVIVRVVPERTLAYVWGYSVIEWRLEPDGAGCRYSFADHGQIHPPEGADWTAEGTAAGWHAWMDSVEHHLDGVAPPPFHGSPRENELQSMYRKRITALEHRS